MDVLFGIVILADFVARIAISRQLIRELLHPSTWADAAAIVSFLAPIIGEGVGFLRILRTLRLMRTYHLLAQLRADSRFFRRNEDVIFAVANLACSSSSPPAWSTRPSTTATRAIHNWADALYFTVTALTTTGFGDITLPGTLGRLISVTIMIFGVTLFFNLARALISPSKVRFHCPTCGLHAARLRRRALQGLRRAAQHSRRGPGLVSAGAPRFQARRRTPYPWLRRAGPPAAPRCARHRP